MVFLLTLNDFLWHHQIVITVNCRNGLAASSHISNMVSIRTSSQYSLAQYPSIFFVREWRTGRSHIKGICPFFTVHSCSWL